MRILILLLVLAACKTLPEHKRFDHQRDSMSKER